jgi:beta-N-acetylhexosaminidase
MAILDDLARAPFNLDAGSIGWVRETLAALSPEDKLRQLFNLRLRSLDPADAKPYQDFRPGGVTYNPGTDLEVAARVLEGFNAAAPVPVIVSADLEGSRMSLAAGTEMPNPLALAALDDVEVTRKVATIMAQEARAVGIDWSFTPVLDINAAWRSAIVATRGFGADVATIERHAIATMEAFQAEGVAAAVKHWPGEGFDERDQHLVTTVNPLSMDEWEKNFGKLYRAAIDAGVLSVMAGHIALPAFVRELDPNAGKEAFRPASLSRVLNEELLRRRLGFNGLIVSDATAMAGMGAWDKRSITIPEVVENGCDVILFTTDADQDLQYLKDALAGGRLSQRRVDEALARLLGLKAKLGLHRPSRRDTSVLGTRKSRTYSEAVTRRIPTLVKDTQGLLPLDPAVHRRVLVITPGIVEPWVPQPLPFALPDMLEARGFAITIYAPGTPMTADNFDLVLILSGEETLMTRGRIGFDWLRTMGNPGTAMQRPWHDVPTVMISFGYPYLLYDAPRVPTYINAYTTTESMQSAVCDLLLGNGAWNRNSPVDPFCGLEDARY